MKTKFKVTLTNDMGNVVDTKYFKTQSNMEEFIYQLDDKQLFKAYISNSLYCKHSRL